MTLLAFLAALGSAMLHAGWNALARSRPEPGAAFCAVVVAAGVISLPLVVWRGLPTVPEAWFWLAVGFCFNLSAVRLTMAAYRRLPLSLAYPLSRGTAPLLVALIEFGLLGRAVPGAGVLVGMVIVSLAVLLLAKSARTGEGLDRRGLLYTMGVAVCTAVFSITDALGVRASGDPFAYGAAVAIVTAVGLPLLQHFEGVHIGRMLRGNMVFGLFVSFLSMGSYLLVLYAFMNAPVAPSSAIRETSVLFGAVLAALFLGETFGRLRWFAIALAVVGVATIRLS